MTCATILIPAHNEASVIDRTLLHLSRGLSCEDFHVVVIANACSDATASRAKSILPQATVIETPNAGKAQALNLGYEVAAKDKPIVCLDADLDITAESVRALIAPLCNGEARASCGHMDVSASEATTLVRAYYMGWRMNPYFDRGKFGGVFALSPEAAELVFPLPGITADDEYVRRSFALHETACVDDCRFTARAPQTLSSLIRVRRRSIRGAREITALGLPNPERSSVRILLRRLVCTPRKMIPIVTYGSINALVRLQISLEGRSAAKRWERDLTNRATG